LDFFNGLLNELMSGDRPLLSFIFFLNIALLLLSRPIIQLIAPDQDNKTKIKIAQGLNLLVLIFQIVDFALRRSFEDYSGGYLVNLGLSLIDRGTF